LTEPVRAALLVGCDEYSDPELPSLPGAANDVRQLAELLADPAVGRFGEVHTLPGEHRGTSQREITEAIDAFFRGRRPDDFLLLYFAGHGIQGAAGDLIFCARDTFVDTRNVTGVAASWVSERIAWSRSSRVLVLLDCCFSGAFPAGFRPRASQEVRPLEAVQGRGRVVITASTATEHAYENGRLVQGRPTHTAVFTASVVTGLATGSADRDGDGKVSVSDLYGYVYNEVRLWGHQTPTMRGEIAGELYVSYRGQPSSLEMTGDFAPPDRRAAPTRPVPKPRPAPAVELIRPRILQAPRLRGNQSATVRRWLCAVGQRVFHDTPVLEIQYVEGGRTSIVEVRAAVEGVLRGMSVVEGERISGASALGLVALGARPNHASARLAPRFPAKDGIVRLAPVKLPRPEPSRPITVVSWSRAIGDRVEIGAPLLRVRVGDAELDVLSPAGGTLRAMALLAGETAAGDDVVAVVSVE
jgi:hypothetical protein